MQRALQELESRGLLASQRTAGRCVTGSGEAIAALRGRLAAAQAALFLERMGQLGYSRAESLAFLQPAGSPQAGGAGERTAADRAQAPNAPKEE